MKDKRAVPNLKRDKPQVKENGDKERDISVSQGRIERLQDYAFNPSRDKIREVTIVDPFQARLMPQLDIVNTLFHYCLEVATFRKDYKLYEELYEKPCPVPPDLTEEFIYRTAQWQKSIAGKNLEKAMNAVLAELEVKDDEEKRQTGADPWD